MLDRILKLGVRQLFGGSRRGQPLVAAAGAAIVILGWLRRRGVADQLLFAEDLVEGESMHLTFRRGAPVVDSASTDG